MGDHLQCLVFAADGKEGKAIFFVLINKFFQENESAIDFANRVKKTIAVRGGMVDLEWDGGLKRSKVPTRLLQKQQEK